MKTCCKCLLEKKLSEFYTYKKNSDGYLNRCKSCAKSDSTANRARNLERFRSYDRSRHMSEKNVARRERWASENPEKIRAIAAVKRAVKKGSIKKDFCSSCGGSDAVAHHDDYSKPLSVRWLCRSCHRKHHFNQSKK